MATAHDEGYRWPTDLDEDLARSLHDSFKSAPPYSSYVPRDYYPRGYRSCGCCSCKMALGTIWDAMGCFIIWNAFVVLNVVTLLVNPSSLCREEMLTPNPASDSLPIPNLKSVTNLFQCRCHPFW